MLPWLMRAAGFFCILPMLGAAGCVDQTRCMAALDRYERLQEEASRRDLRIQSLEQMQWALLYQFGSRDVAGREALAKRITALEADNQELAIRARQAEGALELERVQRDPSSGAMARRPLDEDMPYIREPDIIDDYVSFDPRKEGRRSFPRRVLDEAGPYDPPLQRPPSTVHKRTVQPSRAPRGVAAASTSGVISTPPRTAPKRAPKVPASDVLPKSPSTGDGSRRTLDESVPYR